MLLIYTFDSYIILILICLAFLVDDIHRRVIIQFLLDYTIQFLFLYFISYNIHIFINQLFVIKLYLSPYLYHKNMSSLKRSAPY